MADLRSVGAARLRRTLAAIAVAHPFYRARFRELGVSAGDVRSLDDLRTLPLTRKEDYISDPEAFRLRPQDLPADCSPEERVLWDIAYTTGTTSGRPSPFYNTAHDAYAIWDQARRCNEAEGLTASDRVANLYPLAGFPTGAFLSVIRSTMIAGLPVVHGLTGSANSEFKVRNSLADALATVARFRPTVLWGVPSFIRRFLDEACRQGADLSDVRLVLTSGEPVGETLRATLRDRLAQLGAPAIAIRARYAFTEMQGGLVQCAEGAAPQNLVPDLYHLEVVDPDTGRSLADGESGALASLICTVAAPFCCAILWGISSRCRARRARSAAVWASAWLRRRGAPAISSNAGECWSTPMSLLTRSRPLRSSPNSRSCLQAPVRRMPWSGW